MSSASHLHAIDRLRVLLTGLVILHHTAITYGAAGDWFYRELAPGPSFTSQLLTLFCAVNQSFFMGFFFLLAGYFTPGSIQRKGGWGYLMDRLVRLGLPLVFFGLVLGPLTMLLAGGTPSRVLGGYLPWVLGPLWFAWALLLFSGVWLALSRWGVQWSSMNRSLPGHGGWAAAAFLVGLGAWLMRQWMPVGQTLVGLQLGYFVSYAFLFVLGCRAASGAWCERLSWQQVRPWWWVSIVTIPLLPLVLQMAETVFPGTQDFRGGNSASALIYAFWEPWVAWGLIATLLVVFRDRFNQPQRVWTWLASHAYAAFVLHAPVLVFVSRLLADWAAPTLIKFVVVGPVATVVTFVLAGAIKTLPHVGRAV